LTFACPKRAIRVKQFVAEIFIHRKDDTISTDKMGNLSLANRELNKAIKKGDIKWAMIINHFGGIEAEYHDPDYAAFLVTLAGGGKKIDKKISKDALSKLEKENPALFDKYLEWIFQKKTVLG
jgi:hypothetical protein